MWLFLALGAQAALGIATLLNHVPVSLALLHQFGAVVILAIAIAHLHRLTGGTPVPVEAARPA